VGGWVGGCGGGGGGVWWGGKSRTSSPMNIVNIGREIDQLEDVLILVTT